ncbi:chromosomal replication initiator protein DnaA [Actinomadura algeriensis]|uniref:Uncharacterized protein n=1 Tax=Actinomadura algeriensis TaxID=1679523 RepID=A0ABR9JYL7_9ACTN|nr:hypothetical protein [Actinomadura algeriensis]MBE1535671.1 hypothetical protein [Actinomadura algeriensis]
MTKAIPGANMNRFVPDLSLAAVAGGLCRSACGALGCTAAAGVISIGAPAAAAEATAVGEPRPRRQLSADYGPASGRGVSSFRAQERPTGDQQPAARQAPTGARPPDRIGAAHTPAPAGHETSEPFERPTRPPAPPERHTKPATAVNGTETTRRGSAPPRTDAHLRPSPVHSPDGPVRPLETVLLLLLLFPVIAGICYPLRRRASARTPPAEPSPRTVLRCRPPFDPFTIDAVGLAGPGALATSRVMALAALGTHTPALVVIPRPDATRMFGLDEDEFLDEDITELFIPGNLDAALAYLETELTIRQKAGKPSVPRLLLIADCAGETDRIHALLARHPGGVSAILMGPWTGDRATVTAGGLVIGPPATTELPDRLPTMSTVQARDLLHAAAVPPPVRRRPSRRP